MNMKIEIFFDWLLQFFFCKCIILNLESDIYLLEDSENKMYVDWDIVRFNWNIVLDA